MISDIRESMNTSAPARHSRSWGRRALCFLLAVLLPLHATVASAQTVYFHNDVAGSPIAATDETGNLLWKESYRPYGEKTLRPSTSNGQWFHGKDLDSETNIENFGARNYDPVLGRFLSIDPLDFQEKNIHSFNRYAYGNNNPLRYKDPDGRAGVALEFVALAGLAVVVGGYLASPPGPSGPPRTSGEALPSIPTPGKVISDIVMQVGGFLGQLKDARDSIMTKIHGNSDESPNPQHGYNIYDTTTGDIVKTGISGQPLNQNGESPRANSQVNKWNGEAGNAERYKAEVVVQIPGQAGARGAAKEWEQQNAEKLRNEGQLNDPTRHQRP